MSTTIVNPAPANSSTSDNGIGFVLGIIVLFVFGFIFFIYGLPLIRQGLSGTGNGGVQINVPKQIDVKVQPAK